MSRRVRRALYLALLLTFGLLLARPAWADHCGSLTDCFGTLRAALAAVVGTALFATLLSFGLDLVPFVGTVKGVVEAFTGRDVVTGEKLAWWERALGVVPFARPAAKVGRLGLRGLEGTGDVAGGAAAFARAADAIPGPGAVDGGRAAETGGVGARAGRVTHPALPTSHTAETHPVPAKATAPRPAQTRAPAQTREPHPAGAPPPPPERTTTPRRAEAPTAAPREVRTGPPADTPVIRFEEAPAEKVIAGPLPQRDLPLEVSTPRAEVPTPASAKVLVSAGGPTPAGHHVAPVPPARAQVPAGHTSSLPPGRSNVPVGAAGPVPSGRSDIPAGAAGPVRSGRSDIPEAAGPVRSGLGDIPPERRTGIPPRGRAETSPRADSPGVRDEPQSPPAGHGQRDPEGIGVEGRTTTDTGTRTPSGNQVLRDTKTGRTYYVDSKGRPQPFPKEEGPLPFTSTKPPTHHANKPTPIDKPTGAIKNPTPQLGASEPIEAPPNGRIRTVKEVAHDANDRALAGHFRNRSKEALGDAAARRFGEDNYPGSKQQGFSGADTVDRVIHNESPPPDIIVVEAKGGQGENTSSCADGTNRYEQGTPEYLKKTAEKMAASNDPERRRAGRAILKALDKTPPSVQYTKVTQPVGPLDAHGTPPPAKVEEYTGTKESGQTLPTAQDFAERSQPNETGPTPGGAGDALP